MVPLRNRYRLNGLRVASSLALPDLARDRRKDVAPDVELVMSGEFARAGRSGIVMSRTQADGSPWLTCFARESGYRLHFSGLADFIVERSGARVRCAPRRGTPPETIRHLFCDQVVPLLLNMIGREALHASSARVPGGACGFMGESGSGKSTLAAAFQVAGHGVISDDCLPLRLSGERVLVEPSYPGLRLWADSAGLLFKDLRGLRPVSHYSAKLRVPAAAPARGGRALALRGLYVIERCKRRPGGRLPRIESLTLLEALMALTRFSFRLDLKDRAMLLRQVQFMEAVARRVPVKRLLIANDMASVAQGPEAILRDLERQ